MGSDNIFHKRRARNSKNTARRKAFKKPYERVLIVCEGEKTEPIYFEEIRVYHDLDSANIVIDGSCGSSPKSVVEFAHDMYTREIKNGETYDRVFCVIDRDTHDTFDWAIEKAQNINKSINKNIESPIEKFIVIRSTPCFEYWLILHFNPTTQPFVGIHNRSAAEAVIRRLSEYIPDYSKKYRGFYKRSIDESTLDFAKSNSARIFDQAVQSGYMNPSTNIHQLVTYLESLKQS